MTAWEEFMQENGDVAERANLLQDVIRGLEVYREEEYFLEQGMLPSSASVAAEPTTPPNGVYGVGAWVQGLDVVPAIFVQPGLASRAGSSATLSEVRFVFDENARDLLSGVLAVALDPPVEFSMDISSGGPITIGIQPATLGITATFQGTPGILTAGHAGVSGSIARDTDGDRIGTVTLSISRHTEPELLPTADVAFIDTETRPLVQKWSPMSVAAAKERQPLTVWNRGGPATTWVQGLAREWVFTPDTSSWGQVIITGTPIATNGDSGAPVEGPNGAVVGHIVGGTPEGYSIIQDVEYQLNAIGAIPA